MKSVEHRVERILYAFRWFLAPVYLGLGLALLTLTVKFYLELYEMVIRLLTVKEEDLVLSLLSLIDMVLVGNLLVMVMLAGYENFVSHFDLHIDQERLRWLGKLDWGSLKMRLAASIVAISSIHLLKVFVDIEHLPDDKILLYAGLHLVFVFSGLLLAVTERTAHRHEFPSHGTEPD